MDCDYGTMDGNNNTMDCDYETTDNKNVCDNCNKKIVHHSKKTI